MKSSSQNHGSATIIQFPFGGRAALPRRRYDQTQSAIDHTAARQTEICSDSWYHEEAIAQSHRDSKPDWEH